jgi:hypothetical protein
VQMQLHVELFKHLLMCCFIIFLTLTMKIDDEEKVCVELTGKPMCCSKSGAGYGRESITCLLGRSINW